MATATRTELNGWLASAELHQRYLTGLILRAVVFKGEAAGTELNFRTFQAQHREKFLAGYRISASTSCRPLSPARNTSISPIMSAA